MPSELRSLRLLLVMTLCACASNAEVSMEGSWLLEGSASSPLGICTVTGTFSMGGTTRNHWGIGTRTVVAEIDGMQYENTAERQVNTYATAPWRPPEFIAGPQSGPIREFYAPDGVIEPDAMSGAWRCSVDTVNGRIEMVGYWAMRRVSRSGGTGPLAP